MRVRFTGNGSELDVPEVASGGRGFKIDLGDNPPWDLIDDAGEVLVLDGPLAGAVLRGGFEGTPETMFLTGPWPDTMVDRPKRPMFGGTPPLEDEDLLPEFIAVCAPHLDLRTAGYIDADIDEDGRFLPRNPAEAIEYSETIRGTIVEVFDTDGHVIGYFATGQQGVVDEARKDALLTMGYRLFLGRRPTPEGPSPIRGTSWRD